MSRRAGKRPDEILEEDIENSSICSPGSIAGHSVGQSGSSMHHMQRYPVSSSGSLTNSHQPRSTSTPGMLNLLQLSQLVFQRCNIHLDLSSNLNLSTYLQALEMEV